MESKQMEDMSFIKILDEIGYDKSDITPSYAYHEIQKQYPTFNKDVEDILNHICKDDNIFYSFLKEYPILLSYGTIDKVLTYKFQNKYGEDLHKYMNNIEQFVEAACNVFCRKITLDALVIEFDDDDEYTLGNLEYILEFYDKLLLECDNIDEEDKRFRDENGQLIDENDILIFKESRDRLKQIIHSIKSADWR